MKIVFKVSYKDNRPSSIDAYLLYFLLTLNLFDKLIFLFTQLTLRSLYLVVKLKVKSKVCDDII